MKGTMKETMTPEDSLRRGERRQTATRKKNKTTRKDTADSGGIQRHQKYIMHKKFGRKRTHIPKVKNDKGETITSRKGIANVFGEFCSKLHAENQLGQEVQDPQNQETIMNTEKKNCNEDVRNEIPEFTQDEVQAATDSLASDNNGIWAEDIKTCDTTTEEMIRQIFNEVLKLEDCTPETWRRKRMKIICKKCGRSW